MYSLKSRIQTKSEAMNSNLEYERIDGDDIASDAIITKMLTDNKAKSYTNRREFLCKNSPKCLICGTDQVQLIGYMDCQAEWKCRHCDTVIVFEPDPCTNCGSQRCYPEECESKLDYDKFKGK